MGMYTEFIFGCELSKDTPKICIDALDELINDDENGKKPKYENPQTYEEKRFNEDYIERTSSQQEIEEFQDKYDFGRLFCSSSYYFGAANPVRKFYYDDISDSYHISTRADLKNYSNQIEKFIEYIKPYVKSGSGYDNSIFAYVQYEEDPFPTIYGTTGVYHVDDPDVMKKYAERNNRRWDILGKLYEKLAPEYKVTENELKKHNADIHTYTHDDVWEWMIDYICDKYKNAAKKI